VRIGTCASRGLSVTPIAAHNHLSATQHASRTLPVLRSERGSGGLGHPFRRDDAHGWSRATYGEYWATATLTGVVSTVTDASALVRWEDGDEVKVQLENIELNGETLRRAQTALVEHF
jgi:hypothetical protein